MTSDSQEKTPNKSGQGPYWRALNQRPKQKSTHTLRDSASKFHLDGHSDAENKEDITVSIGPDDFQFIQKKMEDEFFVSPKDVIHDALFYMWQNDKKAVKDPGQFISQAFASLRKFIDESIADGSYGTPAFNAKFNAICEEDRESYLGKVYTEENDLDE